MLTGSVNFAFGTTTPNGTAFNIGDDGKHYLVRADSAGTTVYLGCAETNTKVAILTLTQWRLDIASLVLGGITGTFFNTMVWQAPGTNQFAVVGYSTDTNNSVGRNLAVWLWYTITNPTTIVAVEGGCKSCVGGGTGASAAHVPNMSDFQWANSVIGTNLYTACRMGASIFGTGNAYVVKLPLAGTHVDTTSGSWEQQCCTLPWHDTQYLTVSSRLYTNRSSIIQDPLGIGVFYFGTPDDGNGYAQSTLIYCIIDPTTMTLAVGQTDRSAEFGVPFPDDGRNLAGVVSGNGADNYTSPSITGSTGNELIFGRSYSDSRQTIGMRRFTQDLSTGVVTSLGATTFQGTTDVFASPMEQVQFYREPTLLNTVMDNQTIFYFGGLADIPPPPPGGSGRRFTALLGPVRRE